MSDDRPSSRETRSNTEKHQSIPPLPHIVALSSLTMGPVRAATICLLTCSKWNEDDDEDNYCLIWLYTTLALQISKFISKQFLEGQNMLDVYSGMQNAYCVSGVSTCFLAHPHSECYCIP